MPFSTLPGRSLSFFLSSRTNWAQFWFFLGNNSHKKPQIKLKFGPQVILIDIIISVIIYKAFLKSSNFYESRTFSKFVFLVQLWVQFTPWRSPKLKRVNILGKKLSMGLSNYPLPPSGLNFEWKIQLLFAVFGAFLGKNGPKSQRSRCPRSG